MNWNLNPPIGLSDLEEDASVRYSLRAKRPLIRGEEIRCCMRGCGTWLTRYRRGATAVFCPDHHIRISSSPTYVYDNPSRNFIIDTDLVSHVKKVERWRLGNERSEDALSWNVFVSLARLGELRHVLRQLTRLEFTGEPILYLWGPIKS